MGFFPDKMISNIKNVKRIFYDNKKLEEKIATVIVQFARNIFLKATFF